jgi:hypothetical protein
MSDIKRVILFCEDCEKTTVFSYDYRTDGLKLAGKMNEFYAHIPDFCLGRCLPSGTTPKVGVSGTTQLVTFGRAYRV